MPAREIERVPGRIRIGVSSCLLGENVRYDGGHKHDRLLTDVFGRYFEWVPVCPEVEIGLGTPRETIRLQHDGARIRLVAPQSGTDLTTKMEKYSERRTAALADEGLCGYVLKKDSPSCGLERVRLYDRGGVPARTGRGVFAAALVKRFPALPIEEEGRLQDPLLRENFVSRVFAYHRWRALERSGITRALLFRFHERHKYQLMAHNQTGARRLGRLLAAAGRDGAAAIDAGKARASSKDAGKPRGSAKDTGKAKESAQAARAASDAQVAARYLEEFTAVMARVPTRNSHTNVLQHVAGYVSDQIDAGDRAELTAMIHDYHRGQLPLIVPVTLLRHWVRKLQVPYLLDQVYLSPHPDELMLLNQI